MDRGRTEGKSLSSPRPALPLAEESPTELLLNGIRLAVLMCTPERLEELAVGQLFSRGLIKKAHDLKNLYVCPDRGRVFAETLEPVKPRADEAAFIPSACGSGLADAAFLGADRKPPLPVAFCLSLEALKDAAREMQAKAELYRTTGGVHCAALLYEGAELLVREDVGRHNAVDKVIGRALMEGLDLSRTALLTSGRIAADMILKARTAGIPIACTRSIPTTSAFALGRESGITMIGRIGNEHPILYSMPERIR